MTNLKKLKKLKDLEENSRVPPLDKTEKKNLLGHAPIDETVIVKTDDEQNELINLRREIALLRGSAPAYDERRIKSQTKKADEEPSHITAKGVLLGHAPIEEPIKEKPVKEKRERTQKQIDAFSRALEIRKEQVKIRKTMRDVAEIQAKKIIEDKILKKAIQLKKKQIKKLEMLKPTESDSEEEDDDVEKKEPKTNETRPPKPALTIGARPILPSSYAGAEPRSKIPFAVEIPKVQTGPTFKFYSKLRG